MQKRTVGIIIALLSVFVLTFVLGEPSGITGMTAMDKIGSYFTGESFSSFGPVIILSIIFSAALLALYETIKK